MRIERFDPEADAGATRSCHEIYLAGLPLDDPNGPPMGYRIFTGWISRGWTEDPQEAWLARDGAGAAAGFYVIGLPARENRHLAYLRVFVDPARRREGIGTALLGRAAERARQAGRAGLSGDARDGGAGVAFGLARGARLGLAEIRRVREAGPVPGSVRAAAAIAPAAGYELVPWTGPIPEEHLAAIAAINGALADAPLGQGHEPQVWDADRLRQAEKRDQEQGTREYAVAARSRVTGELAGLTQLGVDPETPEWGYQQLTAVMRAHRGHRLGLWMKIAMLDWLAEREPGLRRIITGNGDGNQHMIAINDALGFRVLDRWPSIELEVR